MVITVTINPAMDRVLLVDKFRVNVTNRVQKQFRCVGGKGTHVSINLSLLGIRSTAVGVVMGPTGDDILEELSSYNIDLKFLSLKSGNSRTNYVLVDHEGNSSLISEKGDLMEQEIIERLISHYSGIVGSSDTVVISGDASNQRDTSLQDRLIDIALSHGARFCLDASGEHLALGIKKKPFLIKPNLDELGYLYGKELSKKEDILIALKQVHESGAQNIIASCGGEGSYALLGEKLYRVISPTVDVKNTVGCGDALLSGIIAGFETKLNDVENLKRATAIAAATAMNESTVGFNPEAVQELMARTEVTELYF